MIQILKKYESTYVLKVCYASEVDSNSFTLLGKGKKGEIHAHQSSTPTPAHTSTQLTFAALVIPARN
jgi:hypothetical protein